MNFEQDYNYKFQDVNIGDMFYASWGYNMTLVDFYRVIDKKGTATILLERLGSKQVAGNGLSGEVEPDILTREEVIKVRIKKGGGMPGKWGKEILVRWDGKPKYFNRMD